MGKVIEFRTKEQKHEDGPYETYYEKASGFDRWFIEQTMILNLCDNCYTNMGSLRKVTTILGGYDTKKLLGLCAAWYITGGMKENSDYTKELHEVKRKYGTEVFKKCRSRLI